MKYLFYKTRYIWVIILAIVMGLLLADLAQAWDCQDETAKNCEIKFSQGVPCRTVHGWHREKCRSDGNLKYHRWCEYLKDGKWVVFEQRKFYNHNSGFESWEYGCYVVSRVCNYEGTPCEKFCKRGE